MLNKIACFLEKLPPIQFLVYELFARTPCLLPHDKSYYIFPHLMTKAHGLILDVGANNGISSVYFHKIRPRWNILAIEPDAFHRRSMERLKRTFVNFDYQMIGLSSGLMTFYTPTYFGIPLHTATSLKLEHFDLFKNYPGFVRKHLKIQKQAAVVKTLDELRVCPDVIKLDCEGMDMEVLKGAGRTLKECRPYILLENHGESYSDLVCFCKNISMEVFFYDFSRNRLIQTKQSPTTGEMNQKNLVIMPAEKAEAIKSRILIA